MKFKPAQAFLIIAVVAVIISGCQQQTSTPAITLEPTRAGGTPPKAVENTRMPTSTVASPTSTAAPDGYQGVEFTRLRGEVVTFWHPWEGDLAKQVKAAAEEFNRTNEWGLQVQTNSFYSAGALFDAVNEARGLKEQAKTPVSLKTPELTGLAEPEGNGEPDLVAATTDQLAAWSHNGSPSVVDLTPYLSDSQIGLSETEVGEYIPAFWQQDRDSEMQFGLPALLSAQVLFYNQTWAKELGFERPPNTPNEFKQQACAAAVANNKAKLLDLYGTGGWRVDTDPLTSLSWLAVFGASPIPDADGKPYRFESKEAEEALVFLRGLMDDGCAWIGQLDAPYETFTRRKALFYSGTLADIPMQKRWQEQLHSQDAWMILPFPGKDSKPVVFSGGYSYGIIHSTPEADLGAWLFARWLSRPEIAVKLVEALPSLPVTKGILQELSDRKSFPWNQVLPLTDSLRMVPGFASWRQARRPLQDAAWQIYHLPTEGAMEILPQLDRTIEEVINK